LSEAALQALAKNIPNVKKLSVSVDSGTESVLVIASKLKKLRHLHISGSLKVSPKIRVAPNLSIRELVIQFISPQIMQCFVQAMPNIEKLKIDSSNDCDELIKTIMGFKKLVEFESSANILLDPQVIMAIEEGNKFKTIRGGCSCDVAEMKSEYGDQFPLIKITEENKILMSRI
jgi:hypothetical protein